MLTPIDIQNREIKSKMGGYDKKDVDDFLEEIRGSYEELYKENQSLKEKISSLSEGIQYYKKMESTLQKALVLAEKTSTETQEAAKTQADSVMSEATAKAERLRQRLNHCAERHRHKRRLQKQKLIVSWKKQEIMCVNLYRAMKIIDYSLRNLQRHRLRCWTARAFLFLFLN